MPNAAQRITDTAISAMNLVLFTLNCFKEEINITDHPRLFVIFNDVSKYGKDYDPLIVGQRNST